MDDDLRHLETNLWEEHELDPMDIDFSTKVLLKLMEEKILEIVFTGQIRGQPEEGDAADHQKDNEGDDNARWGHLNISAVSHRQASPVENIRTASGRALTRPNGGESVSRFLIARASSYRIIPLKARKPANQQGILVFPLSNSPGDNATDPV
jgi:hypothetical protein